MDRTKGVTGIGFDAKTCMFQASDEWWDRMELKNKSCAKFRTKTLEHWELMEIVFTSATAMGRHHWTPGKRTIEDNEGSSDSVKALVCGLSQIQSLLLVLTWMLSRQWQVLNLRLTPVQKGKGILSQVQESQGSRLVKHLP
ncbi:hypothetical protein CsSME_00049280 [Camellia sinensis var. sinensis]